MLMNELPRLALLSGLLLCAQPGWSEQSQPESGKPENHTQDLMALAMDAAMQTPALQKRAAAMSQPELLESLAAHAAAHPDAVLRSADETPSESSAAAIATLPEELREVYAVPGAVQRLGWLRADEVKPVESSFNNWRQRLEISGEGDSARFKVEPLKAIFAKRIPAAQVAHWLVLEVGTFDDLTLYNPSADGPACCRVVTVAGFGSETPTAYGSLREYLDFQWVTSELRAKRKAAQSK
jgi:hypothetical protein